MKGLLFFVILIGIGIVLWMTSQKDGFQDFQLPSAYEDTTPPGASPSLNVPVVSPKQQMFTQAAVQPFAPPSTALLAPPPGQSASVNTKPAEDPALQKASPGRIQSVYESMNGFFQTAEAGLQTLGDPSVQLPLTTARSDRIRLKDEMTVLARNPGLESTLTEEGLSGIEANLAYLQKKWNMSVNAESGAPPLEGFESGSGRWSIFGWLFGEEEGFQDTIVMPPPLRCPNMGPRGQPYTMKYIDVNGTSTPYCYEICPTGYTTTAGNTCKNNTNPSDEYLANRVSPIAPPTPPPATPMTPPDPRLGSGPTTPTTTPTTVGANTNTDTRTTLQRYTSASPADRLAIYAAASPADRARIYGWNEGPGRAELEANFPGAGEAAHSITTQGTMAPTPPPTMPTTTPTTTPTPVGANTNTNTLTARQRYIAASPADRLTIYAAASPADRASIYEWNEGPGRAELDAKFPNLDRTLPMSAGLSSRPATMPTTPTTPTTTMTPTTPTTAPSRDAAAIIAAYRALPPTEAASFYMTLDPSGRAMIDAAGLTPNMVTSPSGTMTAMAPTAPSTTTTTTTDPKAATTDPKAATTTTMPSMTAERGAATTTTTSAERGAATTTSTTESSATKPVAGTNSDVTLKDLEQLSLKLNIEILKLEAVGSA